MKHFAAAVCLLASAAVAQAQDWQPVPMVSAAQKASVKIGGEGAQWGQALAISQDGRFVIWGTDVGGLFRSLDGGSTWEPCNVGFSPRGATGLAIDPNNSQRVLCIGANSAIGDFHGIWLSEDGAASWRSVQPAKLSGYRDLRAQLAFDPSTSEPFGKGRRTRVAYWSRIENDRPHYGETDKKPALYKSTDGGLTWREMPNTSQIGGSFLRVHPRNGTVYAANPRGFYRSADGGATWAQVLAGDATGLDVSASAPNSVWLSLPDGVHRSDDAGRTFTKIAGSAALAADKARIRNVHVAPSDSKRLVVWREAPDWQWKRFASSDGGATWIEAKVDGSRSFLPTNAREALFAWSPRDPNVLFSSGGDYPSISRDAGRTYEWTGDGVNNILVAGPLHFNAQNPDVMFAGSQDYNGASTLDGGKTWTYQNPSGNGWGGFTYGGYAASPQVMVVGVAQGWGAPRMLTVTRDGGKNWVKTAHKFEGPDTSYGVPGDANIVFASNWRSADGGASWAAMPGCDGVYTHHPISKEPYGVKKVGDKWQVVASSDKGATWRTVAERPGNINDLAVDARGAIWAASQDALHVFENNAWRKVESLPRDQWGELRISSVAVDVKAPSVLYAASHRDLLSSSASALRSVDGGKTWQNLTRQAPLDGRQKDGGREAIHVRVHPVTREAWFTTSCYGVWKIPAPAGAASVASVASNAGRGFTVADSTSQGKPMSKQYAAPPAMALDTSKTYSATIRTNRGDITVDLFAKDAPFTVNNFVFLAREGFYEGVTFHRVISDFMIQGGDPTGTGMGGPGYKFHDEVFGNPNKHQIGSLSMANAGPNTNGSQFFITHVATSHLNGKHTVFGQVTSGQNIVDTIRQGDQIKAVEIQEN